MTTAADLIKKARDVSGTTQATLASNAGVTQQTISAYETGKKEPSLPVLQKLITAAGLEMNIDLGSPGSSRPLRTDRADPDELTHLRQRLTDQARINWLRGR